MARPARVSPDVILAAAAREFAERGFGGARVDRIARRARVNKAMLYYYFKSKQSLYRTLLLGMFSLAAARLQTIAALDRPPAEKIDLAIEGMAEFIADHAVFPAIMLREVAEGGAHLDRETLRALGAVPAALARIVQEGVDAGAFRPVNPLFAYFSMLTPIVLFLAAAPLRKEIADLHAVNMPSLSTAEFVQQLQASARRSLARDTPAPAKATR
jgi:TetR/AcrR family transcriptional regulator